MASGRIWDTDWFDRFKKIYATNITMLALYPTDALGWIRVLDVPYGQKQVQRNIRRPDQDVQLSKDEAFERPKYARSETVTLDMPVVSDELRVKEEYYAGDIANALGHVADLSANYKRAIMKYAFLGSDNDPFLHGIEEDYTSGSTTKALPGHVDTASAKSSVGDWDTYENMAKDLAVMDLALKDKGFFGRRAILAPPAVSTFISRYVVDYTAEGYQKFLGMPLFENPYIDADATKDASAVYMVDMTAFELHMTPLKARMFWSDEQETYVWRWKTRMVPVAIPKYDDTDWVKGIIGFPVDLDSSGE